MKYRAWLVLAVSVACASCDYDVAWQHYLGECLDAGLCDGGASAGDAGSDAGPSDAGSFDAGLPDGGPIDAGLVDGGTEDAGGDAGLVDGGPEDAGGDAGVDAGKCQSLYDLQLLPGTGPFVLAAGDLTGDGLADLVSNGLGGAHVFVSRGDGGFEVRPVAGVPVGEAIALPALGQASRWDVLFATFSPPALLIFANDGGGLSLQGSIDAGQVIDLALGDFNGDGVVDVAYLDGTTQLHVLSGDGGSSSVGFPSPPTAVVSGDLNGDGKADLAVMLNHLIMFSDGGLQQSAELHALLGGSAQFVDGGARAFPMDVLGGALLLADFRHRGAADVALVYAAQGGLQVQVWGNDGGFWLASEMDAGPVDFPDHVAGGPNYLSGAVAGDLNADGWPDIAIPWRGPNTPPGLLLNTRAGFSSLVALDAGTQWSGTFAKLATGDFDGDGRMDLAAALTTPSSAALDAGPPRVYVCSPDGGVCSSSIGLFLNRCR